VAANSGARGNRVRPHRRHKRHPGHRSRTASCAFLAGGAVRGGRAIADWPGLSRTALLDNRDLRPTLDLRSVFKAVLDEHMRVDAKTLATRIFPDSSGARPLQGLMRA
jgi:uncharacterized protein (DUF1501 family)